MKSNQTNSARPVRSRIRLRGRRIVIRPLKRDDIDKRLEWRKYSDPLYYHYNLEKMNRAQKKEWYLKRKNNPGMIYSAIENRKGVLLGFISLYDIEWSKGKARLGIYFGSQYLDKGYGTEAIETLLPYYFDTMKFRELSLDVASINKRAIRCYRKCGFEHVRTFFRRHDPRQSIDIFGDARYKGIRKYFKRKDGEIQVRFERMRMMRILRNKLKP